MPPMPGMNHQGMNPKIDISSMFDDMHIRPAANGQYFQERPQVKNDQNHSKYETKTVVNGPGKLPTSYHGYIFQKAEPDFGQNKTWARVVKNEIPISDEDLLARVRKHQRKGVSVLKQYEGLTPIRRTQVDRLLDEKRKGDKDQRYEWNLASLSIEERNVGRLGKETVSMQVILRRQQKKGIVSGNNDQKGLSGTIVDIHAPKKETKEPKNQPGIPSFQGERHNIPQHHGPFGQAGNGGIQNMDGFLSQGRPQGARPPQPPMAFDVFDDRFGPPHQGINVPKKETKNQQGFPGFQGDQQSQGLFGQAGNGGIQNMGGFVPQGRPQAPPPPPPPPPMVFDTRFPPPQQGFPGPQVPGMKFPIGMQPQMSQESQNSKFNYGSDFKKGKAKKAKNDHGDHGDHGYFSSGAGFESDRSKEAKRKRRNSKSKKPKGKGDKRTRNWASGHSDSFSDSASDSDSVWDSDDNASIITPNSSNSSEARREHQRHSGDHKEHHHRDPHGRSCEREREREPTRRHHRLSPQPSPKIVIRDIYEEEPRRTRPQRYEEDYTIVEPNQSRGLLGRRLTRGYSTERPPLGRHSASYDLGEARDRRPRYPGTTYPRVTRRLQEVPHPVDRYADDEFDDVLYRERIDRRGSYTEAPRRRSEIYTEGPRRRSEIYTEGPRRRGDFFVDEEY